MHSEKVTLSRSHAYIDVKMGSVIMTAAIILAGTFAAMLPSGVLSLMQIATIVLIGLLLYGLIILPLLIPAISMSLGKFTW